MGSDERPGNRLEFETLISDLSSRFINLPPGEVDRGIEDALRRVCEFLSVDLAVLWQWSAEAPGVILPTHSYAGVQGPRPSDPLHQEQYPWTVQQMLAGRTVVIPSLDVLPEEAAVDRENARLQGIKSNLTLPLSLAGEPPVGALAFNAVRSERDWSGAMVQRLQLIAQLLTNALARSQREQQRLKSEIRLAAAAELAGLAFYEVDLVEGVMYVDDRLRDLCGIPPGQDQGLQPLEFWLEHIHPDDRHRVLEARRELHEGPREKVSLEYRYVHPARGDLWIHHVAGVARRGADGHAAATYGVFRDTTERRRAEDSLRRSLAEVEGLKDRLQAESDYLKAEIRVVHPHAEIIGQSSAIREVLYLVEQVAPTDASVLLCGETGTGKELVAQAIHRLSVRRDQVMVRVNCAALPAGLVESELFGREKGAYTGALTRQVGRFEIADGSTIFLDEIGELSLEVQAKLLRVLERGELERLGSPRTIKVDVRLIAATNRDLAEEIRQGRFREDLYYRLNVFPIRVPPLRERPDDIPLLVWAILEEFSARMGKKITQVPRPTMEALQKRSWPGNVRELRNMIERAVIFTPDETLRMPMVDEAASAPRLKTLADAEREHILRVLQMTGWQIKGPAGAAAELGLNPSTLYSRMKKLGIRSHRQRTDEATTERRDTK
jgi:transcriptional regulator with GAF, ATPase, and Fis domain